MWNVSGEVRMIWRRPGRESGRDAANGFRWGADNVDDNAVEYI